MVAPDIALLAPRAVMIENHPDARPVSGLSKASIVIEAPVEGGTTTSELQRQAGLRG
jgi:hypothetical protein